MHWDVAVIGAGAAGMFAAARAAERKLRVVLIEKNPRPGVKILMSGGTRCNLTHDADSREIVSAFGKPGRFLHSALSTLSPRDVVDLFHSEGVPTKVEPGGKIFPVSDKAGDVQQALFRRVVRKGAECRLSEPVLDIESACQGFSIRTAADRLTASRLIVTTGGVSYPGCGTTGDGYEWARVFGHTIVAPRPALTPLTVTEPWIRSLQGVTAPDVGIAVVDLKRNGGTLLAADRGSLLFAHFGLTGPVALNVSRAVSGHPRPSDLQLQIDLLPAMNPGEVDQLLKDASCRPGAGRLSRCLTDRLPLRLVERVFEQVGLSADRRAAELSRSDRQKIGAALKRQCVRVSGTLGFKKAEVTAGGIVLDEVDSRTMQSKIASGLYFAGEILDLDGPIGGYNFQAAFSTGHLAGSSV